MRSDEDGERTQFELLTRYLREIGQVPLLSQAQEIDLAKRVAVGDPDAMQQLTLAHRRLVVSIAKRYVGHGLSLLELIQHGNTGLAEAVPHYDWRRDDRFASQAAAWIHEALRRALDDLGHRREPEH